jgi:hypothetical protein
VTPVTPVTAAESFSFCVTPMFFRTRARAV